MKQAKKNYDEDSVQAVLKTALERLLYAEGMRVRSIECGLHQHRRSEAAVLYYDISLELSE